MASLKVYVEIKVNDSQRLNIMTLEDGNEVNGMSSQLQTYIHMCWWAWYDLTFTDTLPLLTSLWNVKVEQGHN